MNIKYINIRQKRQKGEDKINVKNIINCTEIKLREY